MKPRKHIVLPPCEVKRCYDEAGSLPKTAKLLGVGQTTLHKYMKKNGLSRNPPPGNDPSLKNSPELAYIIGVLLGDGSAFIDKRGGGKYIQLQCKSEEFADKFRARLKDIGLNPWKGQSNRGDYCIRVTCAKLYDWYWSLNYSFLHFMGMGYPEDFLGGLYDSEGWYYTCMQGNKHHYEVGFSNQNANIISLFVETAKIMNFDFRVGKGCRCLAARLYRRKKCEEFIRRINTFKGQRGEDSEMSEM